MTPRSAERLPQPQVADEQTPLLIASNGGDDSTVNIGGPLPHDANGKPAKEQTRDDDEPTTQEDESKPMPYVQILLLCYASLAEPVAYFAIFPFVNEMIHTKGGIAEKNVGFWGGLIESLFSLVQMMLMIWYGRAADRFGRKPVLVFSLAGISVATALFGMGQSVWHMIVARCFAGVFAGSVVTVRTMLSEITTKETQGRAFSWYMFTKNLGIFIGPLVGGGFANPAKIWPSVFGGVQFWEDCPYALSTLAAGGVVLSSALTSFFFLKETLQRNIEEQGKPEPPMTTWQVIKSPGMAIVLYIYGHIMLLALAFTAVCPVFLYTSIELGGFKFSDRQIAYFLTVAGGSQALWMLLAFPPLQKRFGTGNVIRGCCIAWPLMFAMYPLGNELLRHGGTTLFWVLLPINLIGGSGVSMAFACVQLCINDISPSPAVLGTANALALTVTSGVRSFAPVLFTSIFALGVKWGFADGHLIWFLLIALGIGANVAVYFLPEKAEGRLPKPASSEEE